jgi:hypothetical protein
VAARSSTLPIYIEIRVVLAGTCVLAAPVQFVWSMAMPEFWYEAPTGTRDETRGQTLISHTSMLALAVLVFALLVAALFIAR